MVSPTSAQRGPLHPRFRRPWSGLCLGLLVAALSLGACGGDDDGDGDGGGGGGGVSGDCTATECRAAEGVCVSGTSAQNCGSGGTSCVTCGNGEICVDQACVIAVPPPTSDGIGEPCETDDDCNTTAVTVVKSGAGVQELRLPARCKRRTSFEPAPADYPGGYCTRRCLDSVDCGSAAACTSDLGSALGALGEAEPICLNFCDTTADCRTGYACLGDATQGVLCWLPGDVGVSEPYNNIDAYTPVNAGTPAGAGVMGGACSADAQCQPPSSGTCREPSAGFSGGSCTADCAYGGSALCGDGGVCLTQYFSAADYGLTAESTCEQRCTLENPECRDGYTCEPLDTVSGYCTPSA